MLKCLLLFLLYFYDKLIKIKRQCNNLPRKKHQYLWDCVQKGTKNERFEIFVTIFWLFFVKKFVI